MDFRKWRTRSHNNPQLLNALIHVFWTSAKTIRSRAVIKSRAPFVVVFSTLFFKTKALWSSFNNDGINVNEWKTIFFLLSIHKRSAYERRRFGDELRTRVFRRKKCSHFDVNRNSFLLVKAIIGYYVSRSVFFKRHKSNLHDLIDSLQQ